MVQEEFVGAITVMMIDDRRRYVLDHAPGILCALIMRRASTEPECLIDLAIETAIALYAKLEPGTNLNGQADETFAHATGSA